MQRANSMQHAIPWNKDFKGHVTLVFLYTLIVHGDVKVYIWILFYFINIQIFLMYNEQKLKHWCPLALFLNIQFCSNLYTKLYQGTYN